jgi:hypothetical protein
MRSNYRTLKRHLPLEKIRRIFYKARFKNSKNKINIRILGRKNHSRRRHEYEEKDVDYINERNHNFNKKLDRFFGKDAAEIKANLERGTAL